MTQQDIEAATELLQEDSGHFVNDAAKTLHNLESKVGDTERKRHADIAAVLFLQTMANLNGSFVWEGPKQGYKVSNVFEGLATKMPQFETLGLLAKGEHVEEFAPQLRAGFYAARKWLDKWYLGTVYAVPQHSEASIATVITLDPDYVLLCGKTAGQMQAERDFKLADGQVRASTRRLAASVKDKTAVHQTLDQILQRAHAELEDLRPTRE
jgi:hypothetical protein